jgi:hypothetical protein
LLGRNLNEHDFLRLRSFIVDDEELKEVRRLRAYVEVAIETVAFIAVATVVSFLICMRGN